MANKSIYKKREMPVNGVVEVSTADRQSLKFGTTREKLPACDPTYLYTPCSRVAAMGRAEEEESRSTLFEINQRARVLSDYYSDALTEARLKGKGIGPN